MKVLHTSDWHLGRSLYGKPRSAELEAFLGWLTQTLGAEKPDVLLVAGDVFDSTTPSVQARELYFNFLTSACRLCRHVVVTAGNHDSPALLDAPARMLSLLNVRVVGAARAPEDEVLLLDDARGNPALIVCAVPFLRDRDVRSAEPGIGAEERQARLNEGIRAHYRAAFRRASELQEQHGPLPVAAMGHLFMAGGTAGDGVRELCAGSLAAVGADLFPDDLAYAALGHLHVPQRVGNSDRLRYSGSPVPMGFGEAGQQKSVCLVTLGGRSAASVRLLPVPLFQRLESVRGNWAAVEARLKALTQEGESIWAEVEHEGDEVVSGMKERAEALVRGSQVEVLRVGDRARLLRALGEMSPAPGETLEDLSSEAVFRRFLEARNVPEAQRSALTETYREALALMAEEEQEARL